MGALKGASDSADARDMRRLHIKQRLRSERGMALVMAIGITSVLGIAGTTAIAYSTSGAQQANQSRSRSDAFSLAEAGVNNSMAVLSLPTNNSLDPDTLPKCTTNETKYGTVGSTPTAESTWRHDTYGNGTVDWCGTLNRSQALWYLTSIGIMKNPGRTGSLTRMLQATVTITPTFQQPLNNPSWNYMFATHTGSTCDETLSNNVGGGSRMYIAGNLCLGENANLAPSALIVRGNLTVDNNASVGTSTSMATRTETYVGGWCSYGKGTTANPCTGNQDANNIFSKKSPPNYVVGVNNVAPLFAAPATDMAGWYENSIPGPSQSCTTSSGTPPVFDTNYPTRDNSVNTPFDLTPASSYTCRVGPSGNPSGELSWNSGTKVLTVFGTIFIDGSAKVTNSLAQYNGQASLYLSGTFSVTGKLCGGITGGNCDAAAWNPNTEMLTVVTGSTGGQVAAGDGVQFSNGAGFQGALYSTGAIDMGNNAWSDGPMVGTEIILANNVTTSSFGNITTVPVGQPGNPAVYAQPNPPQMFSG
jgi:Tfp pilus assembly protein PilX